MYVCAWIIHCVHCMCVCGSYTVCVCHCVCVCACVCVCVCWCYDSLEEEKTFGTSGLVYIKRIHHFTMTTSVNSVSPNILCPSPLHVPICAEEQSAEDSPVMYVSLQHALSVTLTFPIFAKGRSADCGPKGLDKVCCYFCPLQIIIFSPAVISGSVRYLRTKVCHFCYSQYNLAVTFTFLHLSRRLVR